MTMIFSYPQFLLSGISQISLSKAEFLPETFANLIVAIFFSLQMFLYLFLLLVVFSFFLISACVLTQSRTLPVHARSQAHTTHPSTLSQHANTRSRTPGPAHQGERTAPRVGGRLVGGDEPGSSALSPDIRTQWVHSHTCLIAWPIGGGAHWGWRPL